MAEKLMLHAREGHVFSYPGLKSAGQFSPYIGRETVVKKDAAGNTVAIQHPALKEPVEIAVDSDAGRRVIEYVARNLEDPPFWAADKATADRLGLRFLPVEFHDGEFRSKTK